MEIIGLERQFRDGGEFAGDEAASSVLASSCCGALGGAGDEVLLLASDALRRAFKSFCNKFQRWIS